MEALETANARNQQLLDGLRAQVELLVRMLGQGDGPPPKAWNDSWSDDVNVGTNGGNHGGNDASVMPYNGSNSASVSSGGNCSVKVTIGSDNLDSEQDDDPESFDPVLVAKNGSTPMVLGPTSFYNEMMDHSTSSHQRKSSISSQYSSPTAKDPSISPLPDHYTQLTEEEKHELDQYREKYGYQSYKLFYFKPSPTKFPIFHHCLSLFFKWMYSSLFLFIHRESFLYFFLHNETSCEYVSMELIHAICALGARVSSDSSIRSRADDFYNSAKRAVLGSGDDKYFIRDLSICKVQTLLCLAFYDLGRGELTSCWLLSGLAFRVGYDIGFELDPKSWAISPSAAPSSTNSPSTHELYQKYPFDIKQLRSRIYWGSYIADRLIGLVMGRPATLKLADVTIPDSQDIGDLTGIEDFIFYDNRSDKQYACRAFHCLKAVVELLTLSDDILKKVFGSEANKGVTRLQVLSDFNLKLIHWKENLSKELFWNKSILKRTAHNELYMGPRYTFFVIMLSINRPFVLMAALGSSKSINIDIAKMPIQICDDVIDDLEIVIKALTTQESSYQVFCPHILSVYSVVLAISVLLWRFKIAKDVQSKNSIALKLELFFKFLEKCQSIWPLATRPVAIFRKRISELWLESKETSVEKEIPDVQPKQENVPYQENFHGEMMEDLNQMSHNEYDVFSRSLRNNYEMNGLETSASFTNLTDVFQIFEEPSNQQIFTRLDLADALWDEALYENLG